MRLLLAYLSIFQKLLTHLIIKLFLINGINSIHIQLLESYLTNRTQYVEIDNVKSTILNTKTGVPQGSII